MTDAFWKTTPLGRMTRRQWDSLCDGCAKCCLIKLEDEAEEPDGVPDAVYTNVACRLLDLDLCRCTDYANRTARVSDCLVLTPRRLKRMVHWLPATCAYRLVYEGKDLPWWHPLLSGEGESVHREGVSLRGAMVPENHVADADLEDYVMPQARIDTLP